MNGFFPDAIASWNLLWKFSIIKMSHMSVVKKFSQKS